MKTVLGIVALVAVVLVLYVAWSMYGVQQAATGPVKEIATERIERRGDTWHVEFTSRFDAPIDRVYDAFSHPERVKEFAPENVLKSDLLKEEGNTKLIDLVGRLDILPPGFKVQNLRIEWTYFPSEKRITTRTIDFKLADINSEYKFEPTDGGQKTLLRYSQTSKDKAPLIVESLQKGAIRENFVTQVRATNRALGLEPQGEQKQAG